MFGCRLVKWNTGKKFVSAVAVDNFEWQNRWMEAHCDDEMRKWGTMMSSVGWSPVLGTWTARQVPGGIEISFSDATKPPERSTSNPWLLFTHLPIGWKLGR